MTSSSPRSLLDFTGHVVAVTGASRGIGRVIAHRFADAGARVTAVSRSRVDHARSDILGLEADVSDPEQVVRAFREIVETRGAPDVLVHSVGSYPENELLELSADDWRAVVDANLTTTHLCTQSAARLMRQAGGAVVLIASIEAHHPLRFHAHYAAAKAGVVAYARSAAQELGPLGIRINAVSPGLIERDGLERAWPDGVRAYRERAPLGRLGTPADVADACLFLASGAARWITGAELVVDGGILAASAF